MQAKIQTSTNGHTYNLFVHNTDRKFSKREVYLLNHKHMSSDNGILSGIFEQISLSGIFEQISLLLRYQIMGVPDHEQ